MQALIKKVYQTRSREGEMQVEKSRDGNILWLG